MSKVEKIMRQLPPGFRFQPTDEELVVQYLRRKAFACPLPADIISEISLEKMDPRDLPHGVWKGERYFFHLRQEATHRNPKRSDGYWKAAGVEKPVMFSRSNQLVGMKKTLVFYQGKPRHGRKTNWLMHEYRLAGAGIRSCNYPQRSSMIHKAQNWVVCRIFRKKRRSRDVDLMNQEDGEDDGSSSSSDLSCVTQISDQCKEEEEEDDDASSSSSTASTDARET